LRFILISDVEKVVYTIPDQNAIFQLAILSSLAGAPEYIMYCSLKNQALSSRLPRAGIIVARHGHFVPHPCFNNNKIGLFSMEMEHSTMMSGVICCRPARNILKFKFR
jgi:hypothetical protein